MTAEVCGRSRFPLFESIGKAQRENGILQDDYHRYRHFCTHRIKCIRSSAEGKKEKSLKGKPTPPSLYTGPKKLAGEAQAWERLYLVERSWAYALALRKETVGVPRKSFHERKRWRRALQDAKILQSLLRDYSLETQQSCQLYIEIMSAQLLFSQQKWKAGGQVFKNYKCILPTDLNDVEMGLQEYVTRLNRETLSLEKYCQYMESKTGDQSAPPDALFEYNLVAGQMIFAVSPKQRASLTPGETEFTNLVLNGISWRVRVSCFDSINAAIEGIRQDSDEVWKGKLQKIPGCQKRLLMYMQSCRKVERLSDLVKAMVDSEQLVHAFVSGRDKRLIADLHTLSHQFTKIGNGLRSTLDPKNIPEGSEFFNQLGEFFRKALDLYSGQSQELPKPPTPSLSACIFPATDFNVFTLACSHILKQLVKITVARSVANEGGLKITPLGVRQADARIPQQAAPTTPMIVAGASGLKELYQGAVKGVLVPMKPIFYDLAYDLLAPPQL